MLVGWIDGGRARVLVVVVLSSFRLCPDLSGAANLKHACYCSEGRGPSGVGAVSSELTGKLGYRERGWHGYIDSIAWRDGDGGLRV